MQPDTQYPPLRVGVFTISIDLELAWGVWDLPMTPARTAAILRERIVVERLLGLFERFSLRATWAIVAHLMLEEWAKDSRGLPHPGIPRPVSKGELHDHFFQLPAGRSRAWWGRDLVEAVQKATPRQEIGSHSFCHLLYDEERANRAAVKADVECARAIHREYAVPFSSFVFPRNVVGFKSVLQGAGIRVFRAVTPRWYARLRPQPLVRAARIASYALQRTPPTVLPRVDTGMVSLGDSMLLLGREGLRGLVPAKSIRQAARRGLERAAARREVFHLWFHPSNLVSQMEEQLDTLAAIFEDWRRLAQGGVMDNWVMGDFATYLQAESVGREEEA